MHFNQVLGSRWREIPGAANLLKAAWGAMEKLRMGVVVCIGCEDIVLPIIHSNTFFFSSSFRLHYLETRPLFVVSLAQSSDEYSLLRACRCRRCSLRCVKNWLQFLKWRSGSRRWSLLGPLFASQWLSPSPLHSTVSLLLLRNSLELLAEMYCFSSVSDAGENEKRNDFSRDIMHFGKRAVGLIACCIWMKK